MFSDLLDCCQDWWSVAAVRSSCYRAVPPHLHSVFLSHCTVPITRPLLHSHSALLSSFLDDARLERGGIPPPPLGSVPIADLTFALLSSRLGHFGERALADASRLLNEADRIMVLAESHLCYHLLVLTTKRIILALALNDACSIPLNPHSNTPSLDIRLRFAHLLNLLHVSLPSFSAAAALDLSAFALLAGGNEICALSSCLVLMQRTIIPPGTPGASFIACPTLHSSWGLAYTKYAHCMPARSIASA